VADLTSKVNDGTVDLRRIGRLPDENVVKTLTQVKGIGRWTAQMFLIFSLGRPDVFPHDRGPAQRSVADCRKKATVPSRNWPTQIGDVRSAAKPSPATSTCAGNVFRRTQASQN
jgi:DNA-3-methyladenine glycosylase II